MDGQEHFPIVVTFPVHWGEMDALGHVNNARFFSWFETARIALFRSVGILADGPREMGPILATTTCDFVRPVRFPCTVSVGVRVSNIGRTSISMQYSVWCEHEADERPSPVARGSSVAVLVDYRTMQKIPVPAEIRARIDELASTRT